MYEYNTVADRVSGGVAWLNGTLPGWQDRVDPGALDLASGTDCVVGQLATRLTGQADADYFSVMADPAVNINFDRAIRLGFDIEAQDDDDPLAAAVEMETLTAAWRKAVASRPNSRPLAAV